MKKTRIPLAVKKRQKLLRARLELAASRLKLIELKQRVAILEKKISTENR